MADRVTRVCVCSGFAFSNKYQSGQGMTWGINNTRLLSDVTVVSKKEMLFDPFDLKSLLDPRQVGI